MTNIQQKLLLRWIQFGTEPIALFIEPIGKGERLDGGSLKADKKEYYDKLFRDNDLEVFKHGRFIWNDPEHKYEHYAVWMEHSNSEDGGI